MLNTLFRGLDNLNDVTDVLKDTVLKANDAETLSHDALASIDARAEEITKNMAQAKTIQDDYADLKFALEATKKSLKEIEDRRRQKRRQRQKREEDGLEDIDEEDDLEEEQEMKGKVEALLKKEAQLDGLSGSVRGMMDTLRSRIGKIRGSLKG
jgi:chromosome segregation ATPase